MGDEVFKKAFAEAGMLFHKRWAAMVTQQNYTIDVAKFDPIVRKRHNALWDHLLKALINNHFEDYLALVENEGRLQTRASSRVEALVDQLAAIMNLLWEVLSATPTVEANPLLLRPLTERLNHLRSRAETAILTGAIDEKRLIQDELAHEGAKLYRMRLEQSNVQDLIKSLPAFKIRRYQEGQLIFQPGDNRSVLYFILAGRVRVYEILPDARCITLSLLTPNDVFAQSQRQANYFHDVYAEVMQDSVVACIQESALEQLMELSPLLGSRIIKSFSQQLSQSQTLIEGLLGRDVALRLVKVLLNLATEFGVTDPQNSVTIARSLTHQDLADMIGSNRVTITRKLLELQKKKVITVEKGIISIVNQKALQEMVA